MSPGPELDRLIAEKVMGWTLYHYDKDVAANCYYCLFDADGDAVVSSPRPGLYVTEFKTAEEAYAQFAPSTNIAHAWEVMGEIKGKLFSVRSAFGKELRQLLVTEDDYLIAWPEAILYLKPEHICLAALAAVGVEV